MHRVKHDKEMDLMAPLTNRRNSQRFRDLLEYFYYDYNTEKEVIQNLSPLTKPFPANYLDQKLNLNSQFRAWYEVPIDRNNDLAYDKFNRMLYVNFLHFQWSTDTYNETGKITEYNMMERAPTKEEFAIMDKVNICNKYKIDSYEAWAKGKILIDKNQQKLFKFCLKNDLLSQLQIDKLNTLKTKENKLYVCVTRNPIDYLFSSTNQSYTSCLDAINSTGEGCYWMGLGALNTDNSRAMVFLSNGKVNDCSLHGYNFRHFKYLSRAWMFLGKRDEFYILGAYPEDKVGFHVKLDEAGLNIGHLGNFEQSQLNFNISRFENGDACNIYLDTLGVMQRCSPDMDRKAKGNKRAWYYMNGGGTGSLHHYDFDGNFEDLNNFQNLYEGGCYCEDCGNYFREEDGYYFERTGSICDSCYSNHYISCYHCGEAEHEEHAFVGPDNRDYCDYCFHDQFTLCECGKAIENDEVQYVEDEPFCPHCIEEHCFECEKCNEYYLHEDRWMHYGKEYCRDCHYDLFIDCDNCGNSIDVDDVVDINYVSYCTGCAEEIKEEKNEATN